MRPMFNIEFAPHYMTAAHSMCNITMRKIAHSCKKARRRVYRIGAPCKALSDIPITAVFQSPPHANKSALRFSALRYA